LQLSYANKVHFITIYIAEAHAIDEWPLGRTVCLNQHKTLQERVTVANNFVNDYNYEIPVFVDGMENTFDYHYGAWPERYFLFDKSGKIIQAAMPTNEFGYDRSEIDTWLKHQISS